MAVLAGAWIVYLIIIGVLFVFSFLFTKYYQDYRDSERLATAVTICSLTLCLGAIALFPVDIYLVSSTVNLNTGLKHDWAKDQIQNILFEINSVYYGRINELVREVMYGLIAIFSTFVIPFAYFYYEEYEEGETNQQRIIGALKYTGFFVAFLLVCFIFGIILHPKEKKLPIDLDLEFFKKLLSESSVLMIIGMVVFVVYTAPGLSLLPIRMIKGINQSDPSDADLDNYLRLNREKQRVIKAKYEDPDNQMTRKDAQLLENLLTEEKILMRRLRVYEANKTGIFNKILVIFRPFEFLGGIMFLLLTIIIFLSMFLTCIDKVKNAICGSNCGYIIKHPDIFNPLNFIFVEASHCNHTVDNVTDCSDYPSLIIPSISTFIHRITINTPFFGVVFYYSQWAFLIILALGFVYSTIRPHSYISLDDYDEEEESERLLNSS
ncbi:17865_t:CDS:10 [Gigaspora margarita]|uniref:Probable lysosomal cobalamin transporter n=1 Tax=Gigaspora margarita TaxID=4874 RepID=A0ABN7VT77_GIGMA|nr:17865_t:CDS:10 [Gigaspora margarita]